MELEKALSVDRLHDHPIFNCSGGFGLPVYNTVFCIPHHGPKWFAGHSCDLIARWCKRWNGWNLALWFFQYLGRYRHGPSSGQCSCRCTSRVKFYL